MKWGPTPAQSLSFRRAVYAHFQGGRRDFPWRRTRDPYRILVSEIMLQQTGVSRALPYYLNFIKKFPTLRALAGAPLREVLLVWQGLGYNRRARYLHNLAKEVAARYRGTLPTGERELRSLPGVGPYTGAAILAFAHDRFAVVLDTNIRTVYLHHFFQKKKKVSDKDIRALIEKTADRKNPRRWFSALMDYGAHLKRKGVRTNTQSTHYVPQKKFKGSRRELRGKIIKVLLAGPLREQDISRVCSKTGEETRGELKRLSKEGFVMPQKGKWRLLG